MTSLRPKGREIGIAFNFIILPLFSEIDKGCVNTSFPAPFLSSKHKKDSLSAVLFAVCVRREKKHASGWEIPLLIVILPPNFFKSMRGL